MKAKQSFLVFGGIAALLILAACLTAGRNTAGYTEGVFEGTGRGCRGPIVVRIQMSAAGIEDIVIISHREAPNPGVVAMEELLELALETGSTDLDVISGASLSSRGFLEAVENALAKASIEAKWSLRVQ